MIHQTRSRTRPDDMICAMHLYLLGLSLRNTSKALSGLHIVERSHTAIRDWIQKYKPERMYYQKVENI